MRNNSMMMGYTVKSLIPPSDERIKYLSDTFEFDKLNAWQHFFDEDGAECLVYLTDYEYEFSDDISSSVNIKQMLEVSQMLHNYIDADEFCIDVDVHFFVKVWYNGTDMGSVFKGEK